MVKHGKHIHIGTSGWHYDHWKGPFYPEDLPKREHLRYYAQRFSTVEINNAFYQLPQERTLRDWAATVPEDFVFAVKGSRYITHMKKLKDPADTVPGLLERMETLGGRLGPVLFQLPPKWTFNPERLETFLAALDPRHRYAMEFRDPSWYDDRCLEALARHDVAFCIYDLAGHASPREVTTNLVYVRLHGPDGAYEGSYDTAALSGWAGAFSSWAAQGCEVYCYFDNDQAGYAARNAAELQAMLQD